MPAKRNRQKLCLLWGRALLRGCLVFQRPAAVKAIPFCSFRDGYQVSDKIFHGAPCGLGLSRIVAAQWLLRQGRLCLFTFKHCLHAELTGNLQLDPSPLLHTNLQHLGVNIHASRNQGLYNS